VGGGTADLLMAEFSLCDCFICITMKFLVTAELGESMVVPVHLLCLVLGEFGSEEITLG
jgi:hypothetical protein